MIFDIENLLLNSDLGTFDDPCEHLCKSNQRINFLLLIFLLNSSPCWLTSAKLHHWGHTKEHLTFKTLKFLLAHFNSMFFYNGPSAAHEKIPGIGNWPFRDNLIWGEFYTKKIVLYPKVPSMSFCSDFIQILFRFYPDFILILSWFYPDFNQILSRFFKNAIYPNFNQILS